jgi:hypothetical protein
MNFALPAVLLFLIVLPGFVFRFRLKRVEAESVDYSPFGQVVTEGVLYAGFLHACALLVTYGLLSRSVKFDLVFHMLMAPTTLGPTDFVVLAQSMPWAAEYFIGLFMTAAVVPRLSLWIITRYQLDHIDSRVATWCRFHRAPWYYLLSKADFRIDEREHVIISVAAIVDVSGEPHLYHGFLDEYFTGRDGVLDRIVLTNTQRRKLDRDRDLSGSETSATAPGDKNNRFYPIAGDYFVLRYSEMITLNVHYFRAA